MAEQPMKVLVVSDVHGRVTPLRWLLKNETADALFFLGDGLYDLNQAIAANGAAPDYPIYRVRGNCDIGSDDPAEGLAPFGGVLFFYTHGHLFGVKSGYERIAEYAADRGADVVFSCSGELLMTEGVDILRVLSVFEHILAVGCLDTL